MTDKYQTLRDGMPELQREAARKGGYNPRAQLIIDLLAERDRLKEALEAMLEIHGVTQRYADTHIEIPQSWVDVSDLARAALKQE